MPKSPARAASSASTPVANDDAQLAVGDASGIGTVHTFGDEIPFVALDGRGDALTGWSQSRTG
jgi:hypothetical protein